MYVFLTQDLSS